MIEKLSFQTKARTIDHLGREQIADTPTAISELWKNSFDAYARRVELNIFDGKPPLAAIVDDGHGMSRDEFVNFWLVVGTESKITSKKTPFSDRNGLKERPKQGQKGIGRLSCANLGPVLLLISKRKDSDFVAALVDWRLFENPFLNLADLYIPLVEFPQKGQIFDHLPALAAQLIENVKGGKEKDRNLRIGQAWSAFDKWHAEELSQAIATKSRSLSEEIIESINAFAIEERHLQEWPVWGEKAETGTALIISEINYDLQVQLEQRTKDQSAQATKDRFFETLSSFVDPFIDPEQSEMNSMDPQFSYAVKVWKGEIGDLILGSNKEFNRHMIEPLEHRIEGAIDNTGTFKGRIRAFGEWIGEDCIIPPPDDLNMPSRADSKVGTFDLFIAAMEFNSLNTTHSKAEFDFFRGLANRYAGFLLFRDGLRVMPYGRTDNDFFEIESRRSRSAGREFWNHRQMFGRLAISREHNPNLKDKAGREGLLDNRAAKTLKVLVSNILMQSARQYFGSASDLRKELLPDIRDANRLERAREARNKLRQKNRKQFRTKLNKFSNEIPAFSEEVSEFAKIIEINDEKDFEKAQCVVESFNDRYRGYQLPGAPKKLGALEDKFFKFREEKQSVGAMLSSLTDFLASEIERIDPTQPKELLKKQLSRNAAHLHHRIRRWNKSISVLQKTEFKRVRDLIASRNKVFHAEAAPIINHLESGGLNFSEASKLMESLKQRLDSENEDMFVPYIGALESLAESIDLEHLATFGMEELADLRVELERLNSLAQLGIAVEILGHELQSYDDIIGSGLKALPEEIRHSKAAEDIEFGYEGLTDQLRFLSPLRLAGQRIQTWVTGEEIFEYIDKFFKITLVRNKIIFEASAKFKQFRVFDQKSRLFPVFINLVNNSIYWLSFAETSDRRILFDVFDRKVVVSDNGPGIDQQDIESLFSLFFTKKIRGGRGVGLYLSRANLAAGGHKISHQPDTSEMPLPGANFVIDFRGGEFDGG